MVRVIKETTPTARKNHNCDSCEWLSESGILHEKQLSFAEYREIVKAKLNGFEIKKGEKYNKQVNECDGEIYSFKSIPAIHQICLDYDLYPEY